MSVLDFFSFLSRQSPKLSHPFVDQAPNGQDDDEMVAIHSDEEHNDAPDIVGQAFGIEYLSASNERSLRLISIRSVKSAADGSSQLCAYCHLRKAYRVFNLDRVQSVFDDDGVVIAPQEFFAEFNLQENPKTNDFEPPADDKIIRQQLRHELRVLTALARSDGRLDDTECETILQYAVREAERSDIFPDDDTVMHLEKYIRRLYPTPDSISKSLDLLRRTRKRPA
ncbi:MAG: hypothetical protein GKS00_04125 [Alphaproteobacteria bacterium]|nr:hypothetical protein [Alphaproteobacteria bacterium]